MVTSIVRGALLPMFLAAALLSGCRLAPAASVTATAPPASPTLPPTATAPALQATGTALPPAATTTHTPAVTALPATATPTTVATRTPLPSTATPSPTAPAPATRTPSATIPVAPSSTATAAAPTQMTLVGQIGGLARVVAAGGPADAPLTLVGVGNRLLVLDTRNPAQPRVLGQSPLLPEAVVGIAVEGDYVYVSLGYAGLHVFSVADPARPLETATISTSGGAEGIAIVGGYAYVAQGSSYRDGQSTSGGLLVLDLADPAHPMQTDFIALPGSYRAVTVTGGYVYLAGSGLRTFRLVTRARPVVAGFYDGTAYAYGVAVSGSYAYVADSGFGFPKGPPGSLHIVDVSDPNRPVKAASFPAPGALRVTVAGRYAYVTSGVDLLIADIADPLHPRQVGVYHGAGSITGIALAGPWAYLAEMYRGLSIVNVSRPEQPVLSGAFDAPGAVLDVAADKGYAYLADLSGVKVIDLADPQAPREVGASAPIVAEGVAVQGKYAYVTDGAGALRVLDVSDPARPREVGATQTAGFSFRVSLAGPYACVTNGSSGLAVVDITDPAGPRLLATIRRLNSTALGVAAAGSYVYVAAGDGLWVVDISDASHPRDLAFVPLPGWAREVALAGSYAYVADADGGLRIIDVADPARPHEVGAWASQNAFTVAVGGRIAYLAGYGDLQALDVSDPTRPRQVARYPMLETPEAVTVENGLVFLANRMGGLLILQAVGE